MFTKIITENLNRNSLILPFLLKNFHNTFLINSQIATDLVLILGKSIIQMHCWIAVCRFWAKFEQEIAAATRWHFHGSQRIFLIRASLSCKNIIIRLLDHHTLPVWTKRSSKPHRVATALQEEVGFRSRNRLNCVRDLVECCL